MPNTSGVVFGFSEQSGNIWIGVTTSKNTEESIGWNFDAGTITLAKGSGRKVLHIS